MSEVSSNEGQEQEMKCSICGYTEMRENMVFLHTPSGGIIRNVCPECEFQLDQDFSELIENRKEAMKKFRMAHGIDT